MARRASLPKPETLLHEPARLRVLALLAVVGEADFMYLLRQTGLSRGNLSVQMSKLEAADIVRSEAELVGNRARTRYSLTDSGLQALRTYKRAMLTLLSSIPD